VWIDRQNPFGPFTSAGSFTGVHDSAPSIDLYRVPSPLVPILPSSLRRAIATYKVPSPARASRHARGSFCNNALVLQNPRHPIIRALVNSPSHRCNPQSSVPLGYSDPAEYESVRSPPFLYLRVSRYGLRRHSNTLPRDTLSRIYSATSLAGKVMRPAHYAPHSASDSRIECDPVCGVAPLLRNSVNRSRP